MLRASVLSKVLGVGAMAALIAGCAAPDMAMRPGDGASSGAVDPPSTTQSAGAAPAVAGTVEAATMAPSGILPTAFSAAGLKNANDRARLLLLWRQRTAAAPTQDFALGPGDVIEISVPIIAELKDRSERITGNGTISLPFIGTVRAAGLTEKQLKAELAERLSAIMYRPQIDLFVKQYRSRQVAVVGQVDKPGLYDLTGPDNTLLDMLNDAGGINKDAALRILFIPAHENHIEQTGAERAPAPSDDTGVTALTAAQQGMAELMRQSNPIVIGLGDLSSGGDPAALMLPARPGDMLVVPGAGEVVVEGWVDKPGSYRITPGLTLAGAVGAAGGALFAAKESAVTIMREGPDGKRIFIAANLDRIDTGQAADIPVQQGDVVSVPYSAAKLLPYGALSLLGKGIYFSAAAPVF